MEFIKLPDKILFRIIDYLEFPERHSLALTHPSLNELVNSRPHIRVARLIDSSTFFSDVSMNKNSPDNTSETHIQDWHTEPLTFYDISEHIRITDEIHNVHAEIIVSVKKYPTDRRIIKFEQHFTNYINNVCHHLSGIVMKKLIEKYKIFQIICNNHVILPSYFYRALDNLDVQTNFDTQDISDCLQTIYIHMVQLVSDIELILHDGNLKFDRGECYLKKDRKIIINQGQLALRRMKIIIDQLNRRRLYRKKIVKND